jgi:hypothetical protein
MKRRSFLLQILPAAFFTLAVAQPNAADARILRWTFHIHFDNHGTADGDFDTPFSACFPDANGMMTEKYRGGDPSYQTFTPEYDPGSEHIDPTTFLAQKPQSTDFCIYSMEKHIEAKQGCVTITASKGPANSGCKQDNHSFCGCGADAVMSIRSDAPEPGSQH